MLGEDLIAWRDSNGEAGLHRRTTARTAARRCSSAATKRPACAASTTAGSSTPTGNCIDMPNEPAGVRLQEQGQGDRLPGAEPAASLDLHGPATRTTRPGCPSGSGARFPRTSSSTRTSRSTSATACRRSRASSTPPTSTSCTRASIRRRAKLRPVRAPTERARLEIIDTNYGVMYGARRSEEDGDTTTGARPSSCSRSTACSRAAARTARCRSRSTCRSTTSTRCTGACGGTRASRWPRFGKPRPAEAQRHGHADRRRRPDEAAPDRQVLRRLVAGGLHGKRLPDEPGGQEDQELHRHPQRAPAGRRGHHQHGPDHGSHPGAPRARRTRRSSACDAA